MTSAYSALSELIYLLQLPPPVAPGVIHISPQLWLLCWNRSAVQIRPFYIRLALLEPLRGIGYITCAVV